MQLSSNLRQAFLVKVFVSMVRVTWVVLCMLVCIPCYLAWLILMVPTYLISSEMFNLVERVLFSWIMAIGACWSWSAGYQVAESGDCLDYLQQQCLLILPNHQNTGDVPLLMSIFASRIGFAENVMWIISKKFKFTPFGFISWVHDDFFIQKGKSDRVKTMDELKKHLASVFLPKNRRYLVLFPEGGFLHKRKAASHKYAAEYDLPVLEHCTLPRTGALDVIMDVLGPASLQKIDKILDVTIAYPSVLPLDLLSVVTGWREPSVTHVHYRQFNCKDLPTHSQDLATWMVRLYQEKEEMLTRFYSTGYFPHKMFDKEALPPIIVQHDPVRFILIHLFFIVSMFVMLNIFLYICGFSSWTLFGMKV